MCSYSVARLGRYDGYVSEHYVIADNVETIVQLL